MVQLFDKCLSSENHLLMIYQNNEIRINTTQSMKSIINYYKNGMEWKILPSMN